MVEAELNNWILISLLCIGALALLIVLKRDLLMLQLNSYRNERYVRWFNQSDESTSTNRILCCVALFAVRVRRFPFYGIGTIAFICVAIVGVALLKAKYKKPLVFTSRAKRIYGVSVAISAVVAGLSSLAGMYYAMVAILAILVVSPLIMLADNFILRPVENHINSRYYNEA